jgi:putative ATPase
MTDSLFDDASDTPGGAAGVDRTAPLAERMRPRTLDEIVGQDAIVGPGTPLRDAIEHDRLQSLILWGPPGTGKTTLARVIADITRATFVPFSAVLSGIKDIKEADAARRASAPSSSSTRSTASTRRSRTRSCPASNPATWCSSAPPPRIRPSR